jgi:hypothetical protein
MWLDEVVFRCGIADLRQLGIDARLGLGGG